MNAISGTHVHYYGVCYRKLWYFDHGIRLEDYNDDVKVGKVIHESSYNRSDKEVCISENLIVDFIDKNGEIHEVKKSSKLSYVHVLQLKYYMYRALENGIKVTKGVLHYPEENKTEEITVDNAFRENWTQIEFDIKHVTQLTSPPKRTVNMKLCRRCAYYELCHCT